MGNKTFQDRAIEEFRTFEAAYSFNLCAWKAELRAFEGKLSIDRVLFDRNDIDEATKAETGNDAPNVWERAFDIPFEMANKPPSAKVSSGKNKKKKIHSRPTSGCDAIIGAIQDLDLDELRLGSIMSDDVRVNAALKFGLLDEYQLAPLYSLPEDEQRLLGMGPVFRNKLDSRDPIFWRTFLEMLCRTYMSSSGRPPWTTIRKVELTFDVYEIVAQFGDRGWDTDMILKRLWEQEPYRSKYKPDQPNPSRAGVGKQLVDEVLNWLRPMDDGDPYDRIEERFPIEFSEVMSRRAKNSRPPLSLDDIKRLLEEAGKMREQLIEEFGAKFATQMLDR